MPAVELTQLHEQLARLAMVFDRPADFRRAFIDLCETCTDPSFRPGKETAQPLLRSYRLSHLVMRHLELALTAAARSQPEQILPAADALWASNAYEPRLFGSHLLGLAPLSQAEEVLDRLRRWAQVGEDRRILEALLTHGTKRLRLEGPDALLDLYEEWINSGEISRRLVGLKGFLSLVNDPSYANLPPLFDRLFPLVRAAPQDLFSELTALLAALAQRTPTETTYFLRQVLAQQTSANTPRLARRILPYLSESQQDSLRLALRSR